ncbi:MAG: GatB/YqeY domain-containing protein [Kofleriaceae bacterium]
MAATIADQLRQQLTTAMKAKDTRTANLVRMINTKIMERRTAKDFQGEVDDALILDVIAAYKKAMDKARADYAALGERGADQVAELDFELAWCATMLPAGASEAELQAAVAAAVATLPSKDPKMVGKVIGLVKKQFGDRADAQLVKRLAEAALA